MISRRVFLSLAAASLAAVSSPAWADDYQQTIDRFKKADVTSRFFKDAYGYAVFPTIGKAGAGIGGAFGRGRVFEKGRYIGDTSMTQVSIGFQLGGTGYSQIIFFENEAALKAFTEHEFEFAAEASATVLTLTAGAKAGTAGAAAGAGLEAGKSKVLGTYTNGMATFTLVKGGAMYEMTMAGQKYRFSPKSAASGKAAPAKG